MPDLRLTQGFVAIIDSDDIDFSVRKWKVVTGSSGVKYARAKIRGSTTYLHRLILGRMLGRELAPHELVDHIDRNGLNCRRSNLRLATPMQNSANASRRRDNSSGYKGVSWHKHSARWRADITVNGRQKHLGSFDDPAVAHTAYMEAAILYFGDFANSGDG